MEQLNNGHPTVQDDRMVVAGTSEKEVVSPLLSKLRLKFGVFGGISLIFGTFFTLLFYKAQIGINVLLYSLVLLILLTIAFKELEVPRRKGAAMFYIGILLFGLSTFLTASVILQFLNVVAIMILFDLLLLYQLYDMKPWDFTKHLLKMLGLIFQSIAAIGMPFVDSVHFSKKSKFFKNEKVINVVIGVVIAIPMLIIILLLLSNADLLFGKMTERMMDTLFSSNIITIIMMTLFGFIACYCILCGAASGVQSRVSKEGKKASASIAITAISLIGFVYVLFCGIQIAYLFTSGIFVLPEEFTFAEYARRGFFELLAVTIINIIIILICTNMFEDNKLLRYILTMITLCTYIMIASATYRMLLYIDAYHLTFLRLFVLLALLIDAFVLAGVIISVYRKIFPLFHYCVAVVAIFYLAFSFAKPDYHIAAYLRDHEEVLDVEDLIYLTMNLSSDAAPVVVPLITETGEWNNEVVYEDEYSNEYYYEYQEPGLYINRYYDRIKERTENRGIRDFNVSDYIAYKYVQESDK
ncbi:DUF4173 domain-containing protein [Lachnospiraceae bacterium MD1]|uniref:DUF4173 domain-containing protein n=1 Tax=Variimorphobacter saccharofermentans TaxID=2755051 RepID=A0A839K407_9FIRM|nr:DUF4173 domain-containing protein [Variimorphobacter saccharofermentans]MBB2183749.1 DUF4173 domain-containing protein [Variimorphobacter saccharofermentans]